MKSSFRDPFPSSPGSQPHPKLAGRTRLLPSPEDITAFLDKFVFGQTHAKTSLARAVYNHYLSLALRERDGLDLGRHHVLMLGPTGCGKSYLVKLLGQHLGVPVAFSSAAGLVEAGFKGRSVHSLIHALLDAAGGDVKLAERGIVFLDEIDKVRRAEDMGSRDVSGEGVQQALLTLLDGQLSAGTEGHEHAPVDTSKVLFICAGAFVRLPEIVQRRLGQTGERRVGFLAETASSETAQGSRPVFETLCKATVDDLHRFGMLHELVGRFSTLAVLHELNADDYAGILAHAHNSPWQRAQQLARVHGIRLEMTPAAITELATRAAELGTGARGLQRVITSILNRIDSSWLALADQEVTLVQIDGDCVRSSTQGPRLIKGKRRRLRLDEELRQQAYACLPEIPFEGITNTTSWSKEQCRKRLALLEPSLGCQQATKSELRWWFAFKEENHQQPHHLVRFAEELLLQKSTITEYFQACMYANVENVRGVFAYLDYLRIKNQEEQRRFEEPQRQTQPGRSRGDSQPTYQPQDHSVEDAEPPGDDFADEDDPTDLPF